MIFGAADRGWAVTIRVLVILAVLFAGLVLVAVTGGRTLTDLVDFFR
jgi:hypothetical protein